MPRVATYKIKQALEKLLQRTDLAVRKERLQVKQQYCGRIKNLLQDSDSVQLQGEAVYEGVIRQLGRFYEPVSHRSLKREVLQSRVMAEMLNSCLPAIFREEFHTKQQLILQRYKINKVYTKLQVLAPRRMGKTFCVCWLFAALLLAVPRIKLAAFGKTLFSAEEIVKTTFEILTSADEYKNFQVQKNVSQIVLTRGDERKELRAYCSTSDVSFFLKISTWSIFPSLCRGAIGRGNPGPPQKRERAPGDWSPLGASQVTPPVFFSLCTFFEYLPKNFLFHLCAPLSTLFCTPLQSFSNYPFCVIHKPCPQRLPPRIPHPLGAPRRAQMSALQVPTMNTPTSARNASSL